MSARSRSTGRRASRRKKQRAYKGRRAERGRYGSSASRIRKKRIVKYIAAAAFLIVLLCVLRNVFFFITESGTDEDDPYPVKGVDVSSYQKEIDWQGLESEGISFAFIKATEGSSHIDKNFEKNWTEAHNTDMKVGAYHFLSYDTSGETQAENFINTVGKKHGMLPPVIDVEFYGEYAKSHPSKEKMYKILDVLLEELEDEYGKKPIIYTNTHIYEKYISGEYDKYPIWISDHNIPDKLSDGRKWTFCQYTFKAKSKYVADGEKYVDMNVFNGSKWDFRKYDGK